MKKQPCWIVSKVLESFRQGQDFTIMDLSYDKKQPCRIFSNRAAIISHFYLRPIPKQKYQTPIVEHSEIFQNSVPDGFIKCFQHRIGFL